MGSIDVGPHLFVISIAMIVVGIVACLRMPAFWRGGPSYERILGALLGYGETQGRAFTSAVPIGSLGSVLFGAKCPGAVRP